MVKKKLDLLGGNAQLPEEDEHAPKVSLEKD